MTSPIGERAAGRPRSPGPLVGRRRLAGEHGLVHAERVRPHQPRVRGHPVSGRDPHHIAEAEFKAFARALRAAVEPDPRVTGIPSTKGTL